MGTPHSLHSLSHIYTRGDWSSRLTFNIATTAPSIAVTRKLPMADATVTMAYDKGSDDMSFTWRAAKWARLKVSSPLGLDTGVAGSKGGGPMLSLMLDPADHVCE